MENNIFMMSDASYSDITKIAGLAVLNLTTGKKYEYYVENVNSVEEAEFRALAMSVKIAIEEEYKNVVFIYDRLYLDTKRLERYLAGKVKFYQFLWLKRIYLKDVDAIARRARRKEEKKIAKGNVKDLTEKEIYTRFLQYDTGKKLKAILHVATVEQKLVLESFVKNKELVGSIELNKENFRFLKDVFHLFERDEKKRFYQHLFNSISDKASLTKLKGIHQQDRQQNYINLVMKILLIIQRKHLSR